MRALSNDEKDDLRSGCAFCKHDQAYIGPQAGLSINIYCVTCLAGYNVTHSQLPWQLINEPGERTLEDLVPVVSRVVLLPQFLENLDKAIETSMRNAHKG